VPMLDTGFAVVRRTIKRARGEGTKVLEAGDKEHLHHRLMEMGHGHRRAVVILWAWTLILSGLVLYPIYFNRGNELIPVGIAALPVLLSRVWPPGRAAPADGGGASGGRPLVAAASSKPGGNGGEPLP